jgi:hypothetical protein
MTETVYRAARNSWGRTETENSPSRARGPGSPNAAFPVVRAWEHGSRRLDGPATRNPSYVQPAARFRAGTTRSICAPGESWSSGYRFVLVVGDLGSCGYGNSPRTVRRVRPSAVCRSTPDPQSRSQARSTEHCDSETLRPAVGRSQSERRSPRTPNVEHRMQGCTQCFVVQSVVVLCAGVPCSRNKEWRDSGTECAERKENVARGAGRNPLPLLPPLSPSRSSPASQFLQSSSLGAAPSGSPPGHSLPNTGRIRLASSWVMIW